MARFAEGPRDAIDDTVEQWLQRCLLVGDSLTQPDRPRTWSAESLAELNRRFNDNPLVGEAGGGTFLGKWREQLHGTSDDLDRKSTRLNSSHANISYAVFCLKKKKRKTTLCTMS